MPDPRRKWILPLERKAFIRVIYFLFFRYQAIEVDMSMKRGTETCMAREEL